MEESEIDRKSSSAADLSFFGMENSMEGTRANDAIGRPLLSGGLGEARVSEHDLERRVSEMMDFSGFLESRSGGLEMEMDEVRVSESEGWREGAAVVESGSDSSSYSPEAATERLMHGFRLGDMVWGKVKSHPWWPGHIFNEAFASPSVCRMKREGHFLVAFFGDSSYGWFDTTELIHFDTHFSEKSRQTNSRTFVKAVEEAVDEASRRGALALVCRCRNPFNFRQTGVPGYFSVDVLGYEPGGIYSLKQIQKARDDFVPAEALSFVNQLAVAPRRNESSNGIDWIRSMARLLAYRRAVFEEFDETYAQAFGVQPVRPSKNESGMPAQPDNFAPRAAPLSGPLVIAESLGNKKSSKKSAPKSSKSPSSSSAKKNKYVLKRRDETPTTTAGGYYFDLAPGQQPQASVVISSLPAFREAAAAASPTNIATKHGDYVLQKRAPAEKPPPSTPDSSRPQSVWDDFDDWMLKSQTPPPPPPHTEKPSSIALDEAKSTVKLDSPVGAASDSSQHKLEIVSAPGDRSADGGAGVTAVGLKPQDMKVLVDDAANKKKYRKRPADDTGDLKKKDKKKKKKDKAGIDLMVVPTEEPHSKTELAQPELQRRHDEAGDIASSPSTKLGSESPDLQLPQLVTDLLALAMDPFHGIERNAPDIVRHVFLRFRTLVYQKSLVALPSGETDLPEVQATKPGPGTADIASGKDVKEKRELTSSSSKPSKHTSRPDDDPTTVARKRGPSDRQEEMSAKRNKKVNQLKALTSEKMAGVSQKAPVAPAKPLTGAVDHVKKQEPPPAPRIPRPTFLVMKFPPNSTLPSSASLKAKFGRFGTLDLPATRVYWKSFSCKVLFVYRSDAQAAYNHARNNDLFGQVKVNYFIREAEASELLSDYGKRPPESRGDDGPLFRPGNGNGGHVSQLGRNSVQPKSILKKPSDEAAPTGAGNPKEIPRVKFMLGGDDGRREPPPGVSAINSSNEGVSKSQKSVNFLPPPPSPLPLLPLPHPSHSQSIQRLPPPRLLSEPLSVLLPPPPPPSPSVVDVGGIRGPTPFSDEAQTHHRSRNVEAAGRGRGKADISDQIMSLLQRCSEVVANVQSSLGYVPYHPL